MTRIISLAWLHSKDECARHSKKTSCDNSRFQQSDELLCVGAGGNVADSLETTCRKQVSSRFGL